MGWSWIFYTDKHKVFYNLIPPRLVSVVRHAQIANQFAEFLGKVISQTVHDGMTWFFISIKTFMKLVESFAILDGGVEVNVLGQSNCVILWSEISHGQSVGWSGFFCEQINTKVFYKFILPFLVGVVKHV